MSKRKQQEIKIVSHYMRIDGELIEINPTDPKHAELHDRCKLAWLEMSTGQKHRLINHKKVSGT